MEIADEKAALKVEYEGELHYFCCEHCRDAFTQNPEKFVGKGHKHHGHHGHHGHGHGGHSCC